MKATGLAITLAMLIAFGAFGYYALSESRRTQKRVFAIIALFVAVCWWFVYCAR